MQNIDKSGDEHGLNQFAFDFYSKINETNKKNILFSPYSLFSAFAMLYEGAMDETKSEIKDTFHFSEIEILRKYFDEFHNSITQQGKEYELRMSNGLWIDRKFTLINEYTNLIERYYRGIVKNLDFVNEPDESRNIINYVIEDYTNKLIKDVIPSGFITKFTAMLLTNSIFFHGDWQTSFDPLNTKESPFYSSTKKIQVPMMLIPKIDVNYGSFDEGTILELPYSGDEISMLILLPKKLELSSLESILSIEKYEDWKHSMKKTTFAISIPRFKLNSKYYLSKILQSMGLEVPFDRKDANFSKISQEDIRISEVMHQSYLSVDETGTEAAAVTVINMERKSGFFGFFANRPFLFIIQHNKTGNILFMGKIMDPTQQ
ncbi:serpin family protein [Candidatus Lokiarchaeum ossiferum]|uniref:serpin family protein n=1 Tax=Candidatus Lokiarchaeum ossiferum TaxID=2951803 RepID=UPI00352BEC2B